MADWLDKRTRSKIMSSIRSKNTKTELLLKKELRGSGFSYQPKIKGSPDFAHKKDKIAVFVHGCFWHKCPKCYRKPASNKNYWLPKLERNVQRDLENKNILRKQGYKVISFWEHQVLENPGKIVRRILT